MNAEKNTNFTSDSLVQVDSRNNWSPLFPFIVGIHERTVRFQMAVASSAGNRADMSSSNVGAEMVSYLCSKYN